MILYLAPAPRGGSHASDPSRRIAVAAFREAQVSEARQIHPSRPCPAIAKASHQVKYR
jgi:hypothetical protein